MGRKPKIKINPDELNDIEKLKRLVLDLQQEGETSKSEIKRLKNKIKTLEETKRMVDDEETRPAQENNGPETDDDL